MRIKLFLAAFAACLLIVGAGHADVIIDNFNTTTQSVSATAATAPQTDTAATAAGESVSTHRTIEVSSVVGALSASLDANPGGTQVLALSNDVATSSDAIVIWDNDGAGLGGVDLLEGHLVNERFLSLEIVSVDIGLVDLRVSIIDTLANVAFTDIVSPGVGIFQRKLDTFTGGGVIDYTTVDKITLEIFGAAESDLSLDTVFVAGQIPEPSTVVLLGIGILGVLGVGYRRRRS